MRILFLHGWISTPGGKKPTFLASHGHTVLNPALPDDDFDFAEQNVDLEKISTGPADEMGLGPGWEHHECLDYVLQKLRKFAGRGGRLIQAGLRSPVVRNRNMAVAALAAWGHDRWDNPLWLWDFSSLG